MRPKLIKSIILASLGFYCAVIGAGVALAQDNSQPGQPASPSLPFEQALRKEEARRAEERQRLALKYKNQLNQFVDDWIARETAEKNSRLNQVIDQNWEKLVFDPNFNFTRLHYDYYLRGFDFNVQHTEIRETESLSAPIKAQAIITETVYAERYHTPDISNVDPFYTTVVTRITLDMEYRQDNFVLTNQTSKVTTLDKGAPDRIKKYGRNLF